MRIGVDTGGTFTDVVLVDGDRLFTHKLLSTPDDPARAVLAGIEAVLGSAGRAEGALAEVVHGSTVATNALLERRGARAVLLTNAGFEDVLEIGRQNRPALHALRVARPTPVIPTERRLGVHCRLAADGTEVEPLTDAEVGRAVRAVHARHPESVAVVLLHSYRDGTQEARLAEALEAALGVPVTVSHRLLPEYREYERTSTCAVNAYVAPKMAGYLTRLAEALGDRPGGTRLSVMQSDGGVLSAERAASDAVHTILSGPAGGVVGASHLAALAGEEALVTLDMGGTSTDVCFVEGEPAVTPEAEVGGVPLRVPLLDVHTVGAGGGSVARRDAGGALRVGPESAGADPGPACYGRGGTEPTVTDAHVVLGRLPPGRFLGGGISLDAGAARDAVGRLAGELGLTVEACAEGIVRVAEAVMARAIRRISLERGHDPRRLALVTFGGAGGLHACGLAETLGMPRVLVPRHPGLLSAYGMLAARPGREMARSVLVKATSGGTLADPERVRVVHEQLTRDLVEALVAEGHPRDGLEITRLADLRYAGQSYELTVPFCDRLEDTIQCFHQAHGDAFGMRLDRDVEWVAARVRVRGPAPAPPTPAAGTVASDRSKDHSGALDTSPDDPPATGARLIDRETLSTGARMAGPAIITEYSSTTWVPAGWHAEVVTGGALRLTPSPR